MKRLRYVVPMIASILMAGGAHIAAAQEEVIYGFSGSPDGSSPFAGLISDAKGNLYGTTSSGGAVGAPYDIYGTVFELTPGPGGTWTEKVLHSFGVTSTDGIEPYAGLVFDAAGNLYGTTSLGGANNDGTVFELTPASGGTWTEKVLYSFGATSTDASQPKRGSLIFDAKGNLYGTTKFGGPNEVDNGGGVSTGGTVFELSPGTSGTWKEKVIYNFGASATDGANPIGGVVMDAKGNLYGTTPYGGASNSGAVFELTPTSSGGWTEVILHSFVLNGTDGTLPAASPILDAKGNLYGTTYGGGSNQYYGGFGVVYELSSSSSGVWTEQILHSFDAVTTDGDYPYNSLVFDAAGNLYGTCSSGLYGYGIVFQLVPASSGPWTENVLHFFQPNPDGQDPYSSLLFDTQGNLYGTTSTGGPNGSGVAGTVFEIASVVAAAPQFSVASGTYAEAQTVKITDTTSDAVIYYTTNGTTPTTSSTKYKEPIDVSESETIKAIAVATGLPQSQVATATYKIGGIAAEPEFSPGAGTYTTAQSVKITDSTPDAVIYFTTNGTTPTSSSTKYTAAITVSADEKIEAIAVAPGYANSAVASAKYVIAPLAATPVISLKGGTYTSIESVTITDTTPGAAIYYTTNGTAPTKASTKYTGAIAVDTSETVEAIAVASGYTESAVATESYTLVGSPSVLSAPATAISTPDATLNAVINTLGLKGSYVFQYGTSSTALTTSTAKTSLSASATPVAVSAKLTTLKTKTTYYYQVVVTTAGGTSSGSVLSLTTN